MQLTVRINIGVSECDSVTGVRVRHAGIHRLLCRRFQLHLIRAPICIPIQALGSYGRIIPGRGFHLNRENGDMIKLRSVSPAHAGFSFGGPVRGYAGMVNVPALLQMRKMRSAGSSLPPHPPPRSNTAHTHSHRPTHPQRPHQQEEDTRRITRGRIMARNRPRKSER